MVVVIVGDKVRVAVICRIWVKLQLSLIKFMYNLQVFMRNYNQTWLVPMMYTSVTVVQTSVLPFIFIKLTFTPQ